MRQTQQQDRTTTGGTGAQAPPGDQRPNADLLCRAAAGDQGAWEQLVDRYAGLVWSVTRDFRLADGDRADVAQTTWLRLLEHVDRIDDPSRLGAWLVTTARRECLRVLELRRRVVVSSFEDGVQDAPAPEPEVDDGLLAAERARDVRRAVDSLPPRWRALMGMLMADPAPSYAEISAVLDLPVGSIGPTRGRCLDRLRTLLTEPRAC